MAVYFVTGNLGGGKSLMSVNRIKDYLTRGCPVATNLDIKLHHMFPRNKRDIKLYRLPDKPTIEDFRIIGCGNSTYDESKNGLIVLDECGTWFNSRQWADKTRQEVINWMLHARKLGWDIIFIVQNISIVDKQARLALGEHVVHCKRTDRLNIPLIGSLFKLLWGEKLPLPRIHLGIVKYGLLPSSLTVDTWTNTGSSLFSCYDTKQAFSDSYSAGVHTVLPPFYTHGRFMVPKNMRFYMRMTKIYLKKYSKVGLLVFGALISFLLTEAAAYFSSSKIDQEIPVNSAPIESQEIDHKPEKKELPPEVHQSDLLRPDPIETEYKWSKVNSMTVIKNGKPFTTIMFQGFPYHLSEFPYEIKRVQGWFYAFLPQQPEVKDLDYTEKAGASSAQQGSSGL